MWLPSVNLMVIATAKYRRFLDPLLDSAWKYFCAEFPRTFHIWCDQPLGFSNWCGVPVAAHFLAHEPWPGITLHRYRAFVAAGESLLMTGEFCMFCDVDMLILKPIGEEIFSDLVAVRHPGFLNTKPLNLPYESRPASTAYVPHGDYFQYYCGGVQGGRTASYLKVAAILDANIRRDEERGITAKWHDESHWNRLLAWFPPRTQCGDHLAATSSPLELSADYCQPDYAMPPTTKIVALSKDHAAFRSS